MAQGIFDPRAELGAGERGSGRIVGETEIDDVGVGDGQGRTEAVFSRARQIFEAAPSAVGQGSASAAGHHVRIDIDGIYGIGHGYAAVRRKDVADVTGVAFGSVADENLVGRDIDASFQIIVDGDGFAEKFIALFRSVAVESIGMALVGGSAAQGFDCGWTDGTCHIANAHPDYVGIGMLTAVVRHFLCYIRKEVGGREKREIVVDFYHIVQNFYRVRLSGRK